MTPDLAAEYVFKVGFVIVLFVAALLFVVKIFFRD